jgi:hypothetical protein
MVVPFGGDQSLFQLRFKEEKDGVFTKKNVVGGKSKITLLSDAYCQPEILHNCYLAITSSIDFRYIKTSVNTKRYYNVSNKIQDMQKSTKLNLLERGSVLYTEKPEEIIKEIESHIPYLNAGFNYYSIESLN